MKISNLVFSTLLLPFVTSNEAGCIVDVETGKDYFPDKVEVEVSNLFSVEYSDTYKIVTNKAANETYLLYQCGTEPPPDQMDEHTAVVPVPLSQVGLLYTTMIPFLEILGRRESIAAYLGNQAFVSSPCLRQLFDEGKVEEVLQPSNATAITNVPLDLPTFVGNQGDTAFSNAFRVSTSEELKNLGVYEWLKFYSVFFNEEKKATELFEATKKRYMCSEENAGRLACDDKPKPVVLWGAYFENTGWAFAKCPNYYCEFAESCGAEILHAPEDFGENEKWGTTYMTTEQFVEFGKDADVWIYTSTDYNNIATKFAAELADFKSVKNNNVYDTQGSGSGAWFEQRLAEPDVILQDFCAVVGMENTASPFQHERAWLRHIDEAVGDLDQCEDPTAPLVVEGTQCAALPTDFCEQQQPADPPLGSNEDPDPDGAFGTPFASIAVLVIAVIVANTY